MYVIRCFGMEWKQISSCMRVRVRLVTRTRSLVSSLRQPCQITEIIYLYILGPLPVNKSGNTFILVMVDQFNKWTELKTLPNQTAEPVANTTVTEFISRMGCADQIFTGQ